MKMEGMKKINTARSPRTPMGDHSSPTFEQLLQGESSSWSSPKSAKDHIHENSSGYQNKKSSVLTKVKEKAKKLKYSLSKKKHNYEDTSSPSSPVALNDEKKNNNDPEFLGTPVYKSEQASDDCKETIREQPRVVPIVSGKHILPSSITAENVNQEENKSEYKAEARVSETCATTTESETGDFPGNYGMQNLENSGQQNWDKGVSVKEYLMQKFEPGDNERALSQAIKEAISPTKTHGREKGVVEMFKGAVTSLLRNEETTPQSSVLRHEAKTLQPVITNSSPPIPVSTHPEQVLEEENHGRILQTN